MLQADMPVLCHWPECKFQNYTFLHAGLPRMPQSLAPTEESDCSSHAQGAPHGRTGDETDDGADAESRWWRRRWRSTKKSFSVNWRLKAKLRAEMSGGNAATATQKAAVDKQKREYGRRGIKLAEFDRTECKDPYFLNRTLMFRSHASCSFWKRRRLCLTADIKPMDFAIVDQHCIVRKGADGALTLIGGRARHHNGAR